MKIYKNHFSDICIKIKFNKTNTFGIVLDSNFEYIVEFHDRNFVIPTSNPDIVPKNMLAIEKNVYTHIYLKVNMCTNTIAVRLTPQRLKPKYLQRFFAVRN